jgi:hypothetical protein
MHWLTDHVNGVTLCFWTAVTNESTVHPPGNMSMENYGGMMLTGENSWFIRQSALRQSYQQSHIGANQEDLGKWNEEQEVHSNMQKSKNSCRTGPHLSHFSCLTGLVGSSVIKVFCEHFEYCYCLQGGTAQGILYTDLLCFPIRVLIIPGLPTRSAGSNQQIHLVAKQKKLGKKRPWI